MSHIIQGPSCGILGYPPTIGTGISPNGQYVCGYYYHCTQSGIYKAFVYRTATSQFITLPLPAGMSSNTANDVNDAGLVVGSYSGLSGEFGFVYDINIGQYIAELPPAVAGTNCVANAINASNMVCGTRTIQISPTRTSAFIWDLGNGFNDLGLIKSLSTGARGINDNKMIVGWNGSSALSPNTRALILQNNQSTILAPIPDGINSTANNVNNRDQFIVAGQFVVSGASRHFIWSQGTLTPLVPLPGFEFTTSGCLTNSGIAMGLSRISLSSATVQPCYWVGGSPHDLVRLYPPNQGISTSAPVSVSDMGVIMVDRADALAVLMLAPIAPAAGDTNCDERVNVNDLLNVINTWGPCAGCGADLNGDGVVGIADLLLVIENWTFD